MNILVAIESFYDGGAEMFAIRLANEIAISENVVFLELYPFRSNEKIQQRQIDSRRVKVVQVGKNFYGDKLNNIRSRNKIVEQFRRLQRWLNKKAVIATIRKNKIGIVHSHSWETDLYFSKLKDEVNFKMVSSFHGHYELMKSKGAYFTRHATYALNRIDKVVYLTNEHAATLDELSIPKHKRERIFHGLNATRTMSIKSAVTDTPVRFALVARGIPEKGWEQAIEAFAILNNIYPGTNELHLIGGSDYVDELKEKCTSSNIYFHGYCEDVMSKIKDMHVGLLPSYYKAESLPVSVIEFLFCGKPVIACNVGAIREMLTDEDKTAGFLLELKNGKTDPADIVQAAEIYISDRCKITEHSAIAIMAAKKFDMEHCVNAYKVLYSGLLASA